MYQIFRPVESFHSASLDDNPLLYSGQRPADSSMTDGQNVRHRTVVSTVPARLRNVRTDTTDGMLNRILAQPEITELVPSGSAPVVSAQAYIAYVASLKPQPGNKTPRLAFKHTVHAIVASSLEKSKVVHVQSNRRFSWANPSTSQTYSDMQHGSPTNELYILPTSELAIGGRADDKARRRVLHGLETHTERRIIEATRDIV
jgi:hypothetical protein